MCLETEGHSPGCYRHRYVGCGDEQRQRSYIAVDQLAVATRQAEALERIDSALERVATALEALWKMRWDEVKTRPCP
jgi:hypothetical protein